MFLEPYSEQGLSFVSTNSLSFHISKQLIPRLLPVIRIEKPGIWLWAVKEKHLEHVLMDSKIKYIHQQKKKNSRNNWRTKQSLWGEKVVDLPRISGQDSTKKKHLNMHIFKRAQRYSSSLCTCNLEFVVIQRELSQRPSDLKESAPDTGPMPQYKKPIWSNKEVIKFSS